MNKNKRDALEPEKNVADTAVNVLKYVLGMLLNLVLMVAVVFFVFSAFGWGHSEGERFAAELLAERRNYEFDPNNPYADDYGYVQMPNIEFVVSDDTTVADMARRLEDEGIIQNRLLYQLEMIVRGATADYAPGTFALNLSMSSVEIDRVLRRRLQAVAPHETITIPPGWTIRDMAEYFEYREFFPAERFIYVAQYGHFSFGFLMDVPTDRPNRLEGYLFPDTYQIPINPLPADIITRMLHNFGERFDEEMFYQMEELGLTIDEVVIMASIIEREAGGPAAPTERPLISQVIHERLRINMRLEMCSTVKYAMDDPPLHLLNVHLAVDTPHNTYIHPGLPIGPISNPGEAAIRAALWPSPTNYLFFVLRDEYTGEHHFSRTLEEHNAARDRYL
ncbi:MAG: endolytic transglycosylase MltG [Defluviitaleaceae bacterium]|nr:endolytic transglycosylase MltG [Defluviitaleaceae bacterium]